MVLATKPKVISEGECIGLVSSHSGIGSWCVCFRFLKASKSYDVFSSFHSVRICGNRVFGWFAWESLGDFGKFRKL